MNNIMKYLQIEALSESLRGKISINYCDFTPFFNIFHCFFYA